MKHRRSFGELEQKLNYRFSDVQLIDTALTHPSYAGEHRVADYQRLEFLGDAVFELTVSRMLYDRYPEWDEGRLTRLRAAMVREETLSRVARDLDLGPLIALSVGEERTGGAEKPSILCDVCEAVVAAVYLDGGFDAARALVERLMRAYLPGLEEDGLDDKSRLQERLQSEGYPSPAYELKSQGGPDHDPVFTVCVTIEGRVIGEGTGHSKRAAQQAAARQALIALKDRAGSDLIPSTPERKGTTCG